MSQATRNNADFLLPPQVHEFAGNLLFILVLAAAISLTFELPFLNLDRLVFKRPSHGKRSWNNSWATISCSMQLLSAVTWQTVFLQVSLRLRANSSAFQLRAAQCSQTVSMTTPRLAHTKDERPVCTWYRALKRSLCSWRVTTTPPSKGTSERAQLVGRPNLGHKSRHFWYQYQSRSVIFYSKTCFDW